MSWFEKLVPSVIRTDNNGRKATVPEGLWNKCPSCDAILYNAELEKNFNVCPKCEYHMRIPARVRLEMFLDEGEKEEIGAGLKASDPLKFKDSKKYKDRLAQAQKKTKENDALVVMKGQLKGQGIVAAAFDFGVVINVAPQQIHLFVINVIDFLNAEIAYPRAGIIATTGLRIALIAHGTTPSLNLKGV